MGKFLYHSKCNSYLLRRSVRKERFPLWREIVRLMKNNQLNPVEEQVTRPGEGQ